MKQKSIWLLMCIAWGLSAFVQAVTVSYSFSRSLQEKGELKPINILILLSSLFLSWFFFMKYKKLK